MTLKYCGVIYAAVAQLVEQRTRNAQASGSNPLSSSKKVPDKN